MSDPMFLRAELARRGLMAHQLTPYEDPDGPRWVTPKGDPDVIDAAFAFCALVESLTRPGSTVNTWGAEA